MKNENEYHKQKVRLAQMTKLQRERKKGVISTTEISEFLLGTKSFDQLINKINKCR